MNHLNILFQKWNQKEEKTIDSKIKGMIYNLRDEITKDQEDYKYIKELVKPDKKYILEYIKTNKKPEEFLNCITNKLNINYKNSYGTLIKIFEIEINDANKILNEIKKPKYKESC